MFLSQYHLNDNGKIRISSQQGSDFAKGVAGDFNPIHNPDNSRFCVPGDLLFSLILQYGHLHQHMKFSFKGMVGGDTELQIQTPSDGNICICDGAQKRFVECEFSGESSDDQNLIEAMFRNYVAFSGTNFPHVLVPLMQEQQVMINPQRPLVIYDCMYFSLDRLDLQQPTLHPDDCEICVAGKRGDVKLHFRIEDQGEVVGKGAKSLILSGLRAYEQPAVDALIDEYDSWKSNYSKHQLSA